MKLLKFLIPIAVLAAAIVGSMVIRSNPPEAKGRPSFSKPQAVEAITVQPQAYQVVLKSQGTVTPTTSNTLVAEVAGTVQAISERFVTGGSFTAGELLIQLDQRDYQIAATQASAQLAQAEAQLQEEFARGQQAAAEWESLQRKRKPTALNLRQPQLAAARANRDAAKAAVERAELDLERTQIIAPYDGRVSTKQANLGQFVNRGSMLGEIYSVGSVDVRLPLTSRQHAYLGNIDSNGENNVELLAGSKRFAGKLIRIEGVDSSTRQFTVIARASLENGNDLRVGQFVKADIKGSKLNDVFVIPRTAVREDIEVLTLSKKSLIERKSVDVAWRDETQSVIASGLQAGQIVVTTALSIVSNGTPVLATVDGVAPKSRGKPDGAGQRPGKKGKPDAETGKNRGKPDGDGSGRPKGKPES